MTQPDTTPTAVLGALSTLEAARKAGALRPALDLLPESGQVERVDHAANLLHELAREVSGALYRRKVGALASGDFPEAARLAALQRSVEEYESAVDEAHRVSYEFATLAEDADACAECKDEDAVEEFTNFAP